MQTETSVKSEQPQATPQVSYSLSWMPDIPGKYTVIATFAGSNAYYGSYDQAAFVVDEAHATPAPTETQHASMS